MDNNLDTKVAVLTAEVRQVENFFKSYDEHLKQLTKISADLEKTMAISTERLNRNDADIQSLHSIREQLVDLKFSNHTERTQKHRELIEAIENSNKNLSIELNDKLSESTGQLQSKIHKLREEMDSLMKFKWTTAGAMTIFTIELVNRVFGVM